MFFKIGVLKYFANFAGEYLCWSPTQARLYCEIFEILKNLFFQIKSLVATSGLLTHLLLGKDKILNFVS